MAFAEVNYLNTGSSEPLFQTFTVSGANTVSTAVDTGLTSIKKLFIIWENESTSTYDALYGSMVYEVDLSSSKHSTGGASASTGQGYMTTVGDTTNNNYAAKIMSVSGGTFTVKNPAKGNVCTYYWYAE